MKNTNRCMAVACLVSLFAPAAPVLAIPALALMGLTIWKTRGGMRDW